MADAYAGIDTVPQGYPLIFYTPLLTTGSYDLGTKQSDPSTLYDIHGAITVSSSTNGNLFTFTSAIVVPREDDPWGIFEEFASPSDTPLDTFNYEVTVAPGTNPYILAAPALTATPGDGVVDLDWNEPASNSEALVYYVYRGTSLGSLGLLEIVDTTDYEDTGVTNGVTYYYKVYADIAIPGSLVGLGAALASNSVSATPTGASPELVVSLSGVKGHRT